MMCLLCGYPLSKKRQWLDFFSLGAQIEPAICPLCLAAFQKIERIAACPACGRADAKGLCGDCQKWQSTGLELQNEALFVYDERFKEWLSRYKFFGDLRLCGTFSHLLYERLQAYRGYTICPLPISAQRLAERGFNQVTHCLLKTGRPYKELLRRTRHCQPQSHKTRSERLQMIQPFEVIPNTRLQGRKILLVDDVYTTGRTLRHAAVCLRENGALEVKSLTLAR